MHNAGGASDSFRRLVTLTDVRDEHLGLDLRSGTGSLARAVIEWVSSARKALLQKLRQRVLPGHPDGEIVMTVRPER
jgi:hypothetical protein